MKRLLLSVLLMAPALSAVHGETYDIDPAHTNVGFVVRHMMVSNVHGRFGQVAGSFDYDAKDASKWKADAVIQTASVDTGIEKRDNHLRTPDFFDAAKYPTIEFKSTGVEKGKDGAVTLKGTLTMHGVTKPVSLAVEFVGANSDPRMGTRAGFSATGKLKRTDFGVGKPGGGMVSEDIKIEIDVEGVLRQKKDKEEAQKS